MTIKEELIKCTPHAREDSIMRPMSRVTTRVAVLQTGAPSSQSRFKPTNVLVDKVVVEFM